MANITVLNRLKMELSNKDYFEDATYEQFLTENDLVPSAEYIKSSMQESLLYTCLDILEAVANDIDIMRKLQTDFITQDAAYEYVEQRIQRIKNRIASLPVAQEDYSPFSLVYADGVADNTTPSTEDLDIQFAVNDGYLCASVNGGEWQILMDMSDLGIDLTNYYTKAEIDNALANLDTSNIDLSAYATKQELGAALLGYALKNHKHELSDINGADNLKGEKGEKGDPFTYEDFTPEQLEALKGADGTMVFEDLTPEQKESLKGDKGDRGDSGVYIGTEEPTDENINVWIDTDGTSTNLDNIDLSGYVTTETFNTALNEKANAVHTHDEYLTEHQDLSLYALKTEIPTVDYINSLIDAKLGVIENGTY